MPPDDGPVIDRRRLLATGAGTVGVTALTAGCLSITRAQEIDLAYVNVSGSQDEPVEVAVEIEWEDELVFEGSSPVSSGSSYDLVDEWPDGVGTWQVSARSEGDEWVSIHSDDAEESRTAVRGFLGRIEPYTLTGLEFFQAHLD